MDRGLGATAGFAAVDFGAVRVTAVSCDSGLGLLTEFDSWRGLGGRGGREEVDVGEDEVDSPELLRRPMGFRGGGGTDLILVVEAVDIRFACFPACVSVFARCKGFGSSSEERSIKFGTFAAGFEPLEDDFLSGRFGRASGWSLSICGNIDFERFSLSSSISRKEAAMAALSSGSCSSEGLDLLLAAPALVFPDGFEEDEDEDDRSPIGPTEGSKNPPCSVVVTSRMKTAATRPGFSRTKSVYTSKSASPLSPIRMKLRSGKSLAILSNVTFFRSATGSKMP
jgi:hypothetical protein